MPVIHRGYHDLVTTLSSASVLVLGDSFAEQFRVMRKEIRALSPTAAAMYLHAACPGREVALVERDQLPGVITEGILHLPEEDLLRELVDTYDLKRRVQHLQWHPTFLRWDRPWSSAELPPSYEGSITSDEHAQLLQRLALEQAQRSSDWWRQVGALAVRDGRVVLGAHNQHLPSAYSPYIDGDPRNNFSRGVAMEATTALHAEAGLIAQAAREGISLQGADLHVSTFPCPACARLVAAAGFTRCYFTHGYSVLAGDHVLRSAGVEVIWVRPN